MGSILSACCRSQRHHRGGYGSIFNLLPSVFGDASDASDHPTRPLAPAVGTSLEDSWGLDPLVLFCIEYLEQHCLHLEGLLRLSGSRPEVSRLSEALAQRLPCPDLTTLDPQSIAHFVKQYFRELPEPVIPFDQYTAMLRATKSDAKCLNLRREVHALPVPHRTALLRLLSFLVQVTKVQANKMTIRNLATIWAPTLLRPRDEEDLRAAVLDLSSTINCVECLIVFHDGNQLAEA